MLRCSQLLTEVNIDLPKFPNNEVNTLWRATILVNLIFPDIQIWIWIQWAMLFRLQLVEECS